MARHDGCCVGADRSDASQIWGPYYQRCEEGIAAGSVVNIAAVGYDVADEHADFKASGSGSGLGCGNGFGFGGIEVEAKRSAL